MLPLIGLDAPRLVAGHSWSHVRVRGCREKGEIREQRWPSDLTRPPEESGKCSSFGGPRDKDMKHKEDRPLRPCDGIEPPSSRRRVEPMWHANPSGAPTGAESGFVRFVCKQTFFRGGSRTHIEC
jgi:hypothetical protein